MRFRRTPIARSTKPIPRARLKPRTTKPKAVNPKRKKTNWHRAYHSVERVEFVKSLPCIVVGCAAPSVNMHTKNDGASRKGHYTTIVPACDPHHKYSHGLNRGIETFVRHFVLRGTLEQVAAETEAAWLAHLDRELSDGE